MEKEGWEEDRSKGDHHIYKHPVLSLKIVSIPYSNKSQKLKLGTFHAIAKSVGWIE